VDLGNDTLLTAQELADILKIDVSKVYALPIDKIILTSRRTRWKLGDVRRFIAAATKPAPPAIHAAARIPGGHSLRALSAEQLVRHRRSREQ
jgi:hypothetical protein